ncbi:carbon starvation protein, predicted membrane protein [Sphaerochaeta pleomorpha str. Grapes]|uniref:Carbon starvation protein, predicted membrane protein n=1 Tax=Sphaerochaeta pleomorpha (strain ATCC BAA-1885 / DSM 22778 / Grapes) TaxID=158190 RepID=G8QWS9_SPHPG|nr:carbon starvation protein A [Sphaerochaeta pleomorpha]AEV28373.1 carbon starvation protein, predicted membrane protein [Sphaerochaeta pleomorpha str. Grapes]
MDVVLIMVLAFGGYIIAYKLYGEFIGKKIFQISNKNKTPAEEFEDGIDYVPTKKGIIFGHHFTSIAGTGPIVGPAIAVIWGWVPALIWVFVGSIVMGAVHDFSSLVMSLRNQGKSISEISAQYVSKRIRYVFFLIVFIELWLFLAILGMIIAVIFHMYPQAVFPVWMEIPIAITLGWAIYKRNANVTKVTTLAVVIMYITVILGHWIPLDMPVIGSMPATGTWTIILFIYAFIASTLPVTTLLQPRDYINAWELFVAMTVLILGIVVASFSGLHFVAPSVQAMPEGAPSLWPFLFITIACGAISGFHAVVASGTTAKQVAKEEDAKFVGYGSMLMEGALSVLVIIATTAGIGLAARGDTSAITGIAKWTEHYASWSSAAGLGAKVGAFVEGSANMISYIGIPKSLGLIIMGVFVASFAGTSLDTTARLQRYVIQELLGANRVGASEKNNFFTNKYGATILALLAAGLLAFSTGVDGTGALALWPLFGANNQALAALALFTASVYLRQTSGKKYLVTFIPACFMVFMTTWALISNEITYFGTGKVLLGTINLIILLIVAYVTIESLMAMFKKTAKVVLKPVKVS